MSQPYTTETIAEMLPAEDWRIAGYGGEHDEAGASIRTDKGEQVCSTASVSWQASPEHWQAYYRRAAFIAAAPTIVRQLLARVKELAEDLREGEICEQCDLPANDEKGNPLTFFVCGRCWNPVAKELYEKRKEVAVLLAERDSANQKWQLYEREYVLPCFEWATEADIDLREMVGTNAGRNCVELLVSTLAAERDTARAELRLEVDAKNSMREELDDKRERLHALRTELAAAQARVKELDDERETDLIGRLGNQLADALDQCTSLHKRHAAVLELVRKKAEEWGAQAEQYWKEGDLGNARIRQGWACGAQALEKEIGEL